jgi:hypothetical protein
MAFSWIVSPEVLQIAKVSAGFTAEALQHRLSRNYRIVTDRRKGQSVFGASRDAPAGESAPYSTQFYHDCTKKKAPTCELHYYDGARGALFRVGELH